MKMITIKAYEEGELTKDEEAVYASISTHVSGLADELTAKGVTDVEAVAALTRALMQLAGNALHLADTLGVSTDV